MRVGARARARVCPSVHCLTLSNDSVNEQPQLRFTDRLADFISLITERSDGQLTRRCLNKEKS